MKNKIALGFCVLLTHLCAAPNDDVAVQLGVGASIASSPYKGVSTRISPLPDIELTYHNIFIEGVNMGYNFYNTKPLQIGVVLLPTLLGYQSNDSHALSGMDNRTMSLEGGLRAKYTFEHSDVTATLSQDVTGTSKGYTFNAVYNYTLFETENSSLSAYAGAEYFSGKKSDYYYGVRAKEATLQRPEYHADDALNPYVGVTEFFAFSEQWAVVLNVEYKHLDNTLFHSPIVSDHSQVSGYLSILYTFLP